MLDGHDIRHKGLRLLWVDEDRSKLPAQYVKKIGRILQALNVATSPQDLGGVPGYGLHALKGDREGTWSAAVSRNYRITFKWRDAGPYDVNLEDYHGN